MTATPLVIVGAGGFGREVLDVVEAINAAGSVSSSSQRFDFLGFLDDGLPRLELLQRRRARHLGTVASADSLPEGTQYVVGVGDPGLRRSLDDTMVEHGYRAAVLVHPLASIGSDVVLGHGSILCAHVSVTTNVRTGRHTHLNLNCTVGHDARLGDYVTVYPGASISGNVCLENEVTVGTNAAIIQGLTVGRGTQVGAGAAVVNSIPPGVTAVGVPAKAIRRN